MVNEYNKNASILLIFYRNGWIKIQFSHLHCLTANIRNDIDSRNKVTVNQNFHGV